MTINLEINNITQSPVEDAFFVSVVEKTLAEVQFGEKNISISLALVSPEEIHKLNKDRRQVDSATDVLSFAEYKNIEEIKKAVDNPQGEEVFLGELILCYDDIKEYAQKENIALNKELANVVSHGVLHLLGFEHGDAMFGIQNKVKNSLN